MSSYPTVQLFKAIVVDRPGGGGDVVPAIRTLTAADLPDGELLVRVRYSSVNYKDALACSANGNIVKTYPFVPGIDLSGVVERSESPRFKQGDEVIVTGYGLGVSHFGGWSEYARIPADWAVPLPEALSAREAMMLGTAGFTAALSVIALEESGVLPDSGQVLVTGASGGVGSLAVAMLAKLGYEVAASTGKADEAERLRGLGARHILTREELVPAETRPLDKQLWAGAVDCVGGRTLSSILPRIRYSGAVAASGLTGGVALSATVLPFILRGIRLIGIDSVLAPMPRRTDIWRQLAGRLKPDRPDALFREIPLNRVPEIVHPMLNGESRGRLVVAL
ncbi:quinone oxidoreductase [Paenibacillus darwinianus]|uniref:Quinone oxidoreductase n=1 Tax=Paenibacillus darwinianus TaxID=1380763 RepID=A0A9W5S118_9BACL|nr:oxidoreductase [Paenibacillus darwinianus]EXX87780.1 quinone oxidoreductase [Paenibacillus darwinianus]EXX88154.1 quinone oxidoreductase [Paenibacillus darwinianus]EXX89033.1 quinone oxidoreductase [Paenibacillus darwinianus]